MGWDFFYTSNACRYNPACSDVLGMRGLMHVEAIDASCGTLELPMYGESRKLFQSKAPWLAEPSAAQLFQSQDPLQVLLRSNAAASPLTRQPWRRISVLHPPAHQLPQPAATAVAAAAAAPAPAGAPPPATAAAPTPPDTNTTTDSLKQMVFTTPTGTPPSIPVANWVGFDLTQPTPPEQHTGPFPNAPDLSNPPGQGPYTGAPPPGYPMPAWQAAPAAPFAAGSAADPINLT